MLCFESQTGEKIEVTPGIAKAFMGEMLDHLAGGRSYPEGLQSMSEKSGLQLETINSILRRDPRVFSITKQAVAKAGQVRQIRTAAEGFAEQLKNDGKLQTEPGRVAKVWDFQRRLALQGHSPIFPWSHMRNWAIQIPTEAGRARMGAFWRAATDVYRYAGARGRALYEMDMSLMQKGDRYDFWKQSSADIVPGRRTPGDILLQSRKPSWQTRNFDALKPARYTNLEQVWANLDPALKQGETGKAMAAMIARDMNYATGSIMPPVGEGANMLAKTGAQLSQLAGHYNLLLSSKLFFAKHMDAWLSPLRYLAKAGRMTPAERASANVALGRWANTVTAHMAILGTNYAFNKMMGWKTPNISDPTQGDFLRLRLGNYVVPFSPMLEAIRLPIVFTATMATKGSKEGGSKLWEAVWNAAHPSFHTAYEQVSGKDFRGRPVPSIHGLIASHFPNILQPVKSNKPPVTPIEYGSGKVAPIAVGGGLREYFQALRTQGLSAGQSMAIIKGLGAGAASALVGVHVYEEEPKAPKTPKTGRKSALVVP